MFNSRNKAAAAAASPVLNEPGLDVFVTTKPKKSQYAEMYFPKMEMDRSTVFQSATLAYFNEETTLHHAFPLYDFDHEKSCHTYCFGRCPAVLVFWAPPDDSCV
jgi:hypothetical protein